MPVFFFIDPDFVTDWRMNQVTEITLSYTFFGSTSGMYDTEPATPEGQTSTTGAAQSENTADATATHTQPANI